MAGTPRSASPFPIWCQRRRAGLQEATVRQRQPGGREGQPARVVPRGRRWGGRHIWLVRGLSLTQGKTRPEKNFQMNKWIKQGLLNEVLIVLFVCYCNCVICCVIRKPPRNRSWRRRSSNLSPWKSVRRVWRRRTVTPGRPKKWKQRPRERLNEKVSQFDSFWSTAFIGFLKSFLPCLNFPWLLFFISQNLQLIYREAPLKPLQRLPGVGYLIWEKFD